MHTHPHDLDTASVFQQAVTDLLREKHLHRYGRYYASAQRLRSDLQVGPPCWSRAFEDPTSG